MSTQANPANGGENKVRLTKEQKRERKIAAGWKAPSEWKKDERGFETRTRYVTVSGPKEPKPRFATVVQVKGLSKLSDFVKLFANGNEKIAVKHAVLGYNVAQEKATKKANNLDTIMTLAKKQAEITGEDAETVFKEIVEKRAKNQAKVAATETKQ